MFKARGVASLVPLGEWKIVSQNTNKVDLSIK